jgi:hypothetical protein
VNEAKPLQNGIGDASLHTVAPFMPTSWSFTQRLGRRVSLSSSSSYGSRITWHCGCVAKGPAWDELDDYRPCTVHEQRKSPRVLDISELAELAESGT